MYIVNCYLYIFTSLRHRVWGNGNNSRIKFLNDLFRKKFPFHAQKFLITLVPISLLFHNPKFFLDIVFSHFVLFLASNNSSSQNIGGTDAMTPPLGKRMQGATTSHVVGRGCALVQAMTFNRRVVGSTSALAAT